MAKRRITAQRESGSSRREPGLDPSPGRSGPGGAVLHGTVSWAGGRYCTTPCTALAPGTQRVWSGREARCSSHHLRSVQQCCSVALITEEAAGGGEVTQGPSEGR
ncbi:unnamed protein product [Pleuronectes platessa]|uniref:Uncharacterized protein n=1 Tax=Pleuronectes platessa TaxID=8262 RepID=A0A9N7VT33_PLEPL|nr:unnamed protein product [Pleuronectes platessa]